MNVKTTETTLLTTWLRALKKPSHAACVTIALVCLLGILIPLNAQTVIGGVTPDQSAILDLQSNSKGLLLPRLTTDQRNAIDNPQTGLLIYNTSLNCLEINVGTTIVPSWNCMDMYAPGSISTLTCSGAVVSGTLTSDQPASGVSASVPYTGGNGGPHSGQTVTSTGVTGLTATLDEGSFSNGAGNLTYIVSGTPSGAGTAGFALNIGGKSCTLELTVGAAGGCSSTCCAKVSPTEYKEFLCYNLGAANTSVDPFTPSWEIIGGYWQWGRPAQAAAGPTGPSSGEANSGVISGWNGTAAASNAWLDASKTGNDPCPPDFRVPTHAQWTGVAENNVAMAVGTWTSSPTNYSSGVMLGDKLLLPATGGREFFDGSLFSRGFMGTYWSTTESTNNPNWVYSMLVSSSSVFASTNADRTYGRSVRCIKE